MEVLSSPTFIRSALPLLCEASEKFPYFDIGERFVIFFILA
jgi:hypothetical protein